MATGPTAGAAGGGCTGTWRDAGRAGGAGSRQRTLAGLCLWQQPLGSPADARRRGRAHLAGAAAREHGPAPACPACLTRGGGGGGGGGGAPELARAAVRRRCGRRARGSAADVAAVALCVLAVVRGAGAQHCGTLTQAQICREDCGSCGAAPCCSLEVRVLPGRAARCESAAVRASRAGPAPARA